MMRQSLGVASVLLMASIVVTAPGFAIGACTPCGFAGVCETSQGVQSCGPSEARCVPRGGILAFNSTAPLTPAYWTLDARPRGRRQLGRVKGKLAVFADDGVTSPDVPGFPGRCDGQVCLGKRARIKGLFAGDRLTAVASYPNGDTCEFDLAIVFGLGDAVAPNVFRCRTATGQSLSEGPLQLQLIRLFGCEE